MHRLVHQSVNGADNSWSQCPSRVTNLSQSMNADAVSCLVNDQRYLLPLVKVVEVAPMVSITKLAGLNAPVVGYVQFRGKPIAVIDLALRLGFTQPQTERLTDHLVVVDLSDRRVAIRVDRVLELASYDGSLEPLELSASPLTGILQTPEGCRVIVDLEALLDLEQRRRLDAPLAGLESASS